MPAFDAAGWTVAAVTFAVVLAVTVSRPVYGLLLIAAAAPLDPAITSAIGSHRFALWEAVVVAFLAGWLPRARPDRPGPTVVLPAIGFLVAVALVARLGAIGGTRAAEGIALAVATTMSFRRDPSLAVTLPAALAVSAAAAVLSCVFAPGSCGGVDPGYFAMIGFLAIGMAIRPTGYWRALWAGAAAVSGIGVALAAARPPMAGAGADTQGAVVWGLLALWIGAGLVGTVRALRRAPRDSRLAGAAAGVVVFLALRLPAAPLTGGPAMAFWIQFGLMTALAGSTLLNSVSAATVATSSTLVPAIRTPLRR